LWGADELQALIEKFEIVADIGIVRGLNLCAKILHDQRLMDAQLEALGAKMRELLPRGYCGEWRKRGA
jgi:hypothetical protein